MTPLGGVAKLILQSILAKKNKTETPRQFNQSVIKNLFKLANHHPTFKRLGRQKEEIGEATRGRKPRINGPNGNAWPEARYSKRRTKCGFLTFT